MNKTPLIRYWHRFVRAWSAAAAEPGQEIWQGVIRVIIGTLILVYLFIMLLLDHADFSVGPTMATGFAFGIFSFATIAFILKSPAPSKPRRVASIFADASAINYAIHLADAWGAVLFPFLIFITIGYGIRFGSRFMALCGIVALGGFLTVISVGDHTWTRTAMIGGIIHSLVLIPLYAFRLVGQLHASLEKTKELSDSKTRFWAGVSHELRTPLNAIINNTKELKQTRLDPDQRECIEDADLACQSLLHICNQTLDFTKAESDQLTFEHIDFDIDHLMVSVARTARGSARNKDITLDVHVSPQTPIALEGDPHRLRQVLNNLINNAIKFTEPGGHIEVNLECLQQSRDSVLLRFEVSDTGVGISEKALPHVFESYRQADESITRRYGGTGLGTSISKKIVEGMDGEIGVTSIVGEGSTFWFEIPFTLQNAHVDAMLDEMRVLILTGPEGIAPYLQDYMTGWHVDCVALSDTAAALRAIASMGNAPYDALVVTRPVLDLNVGQFVSHVRELGLKDDRPIILVDNPTDRATEVALLHQGISCIVHRPADKTALYNALHLAAFDRLEARNVKTLFTAPERGADAGKRILVADDSMLNLRILRRLLEKQGHHVDAVSDGNGALDKLEATRYDLVFVDYNMPDLSGVEVVQFFRATYPDRRDMPFVMLTADTTSEARQMCDRAGINEYLTKPIDSRQLYNVIEALTSSDDGAGSEPGTALPRSDVISDHAALLDYEELEKLQEEHSDGFGIYVIKQYIESSRITVLNMREHFRRGDMSAVGLDAHTLKGQSGYIGAQRIIDSCRRIWELTSNHGAREAIENEIAIIENDVRMLRPLLEDYIDPSKSRAHQ